MSTLTASSPKKRLSSTPLAAEALVPVRRRTIQGDAVIPQMPRLGRLERGGREGARGIRDAVRHATADDAGEGLAVRAVDTHRASVGRLLTGAMAGDAEVVLGRLTRDGYPRGSEKFFRAGDLVLGRGRGGASAE